MQTNIEVRSSCSRTRLRVSTCAIPPTTAAASITRKMKPEPALPVLESAFSEIQKTSVKMSASRTNAQRRASSFDQARSNLSSGAPQAFFSSPSAGAGSCAGVGSCAGAAVTSDGAGVSLVRALGHGEEGFLAPLSSSLIGGEGSREKPTADS